MTTTKRKVRKQKSLSHALGKEIAAVLAKQADLTFEEIVESYRSIERTGLARVSDSQFLPLETRKFLALETKRRVAEGLIYAAIDKDRPWEELRGFLDNLFRFGFTNLEQKGIVLSIYSKYCLKIGRTSEGVSSLSALKAELETELSRKDLKAPVRYLYSGELQRTRALLDKLRAVINQN